MAKKKIQYIVLYLFGLIFLFAFWFYYKDTRNQKNALTAKNELNEFPIIKLKNQFGDLKSIDDYKGKLILIDFWFAGCPPCLEEMKYFPALLTKYKDKLVILSYSIDSEEITKKLLETKRKPWDFLVTDNPNWTFYNINIQQENNLKDKLKITSFPAHFIIDQNGKFLGSPKNAVYGIESKLGSIFKMNVTFERLIAEYKLPFLKIFLIYNLVVLVSIFIKSKIKL